MQIMVKIMNSKYEIVKNFTDKLIYIRICSGKCFEIDNTRNASLVYTQNAGCLWAN